MNKSRTVRKRFWLYLATPFILLVLAGLGFTLLRTTFVHHAPLTATEATLQRFDKLGNSPDSAALEHHLDLESGTLASTGSHGYTLTNNDVADYSDCQLKIQDARGNFVSSPFALASRQTKEIISNQLINTRDESSYVPRTAPGTTFTSVICRLNGKDLGAEWVSTISSSK